MGTVWRLSLLRSICMRKTERMRKQFLTVMVAASTVVTDLLWHGSRIGPFRRRA